jgi:hypothetical protein
MKRILIAATTLLMIALPAFAVTAGDVLDRMTDKERGGYLSGAVEMAMYQAGLQGNAKKSECILNWYYKSDGKGSRDVIATFDKYKDKSAVMLIQALIDRECGK